MVNNIPARQEHVSIVAMSACWLKHLGPSTTVPTDPGSVPCTWITELARSFPLYRSGFSVPRRKFGKITLATHFPPEKRSLPQWWRSVVSLIYILQGESSSRSPRSVTTSPWLPVRALFVPPTNNHLVERPSRALLCEHHTQRSYTKPRVLSIFLQCCDAQNIRKSRCMCCCL